MGRCHRRESIDLRPHQRALQDAPAAEHFWMEFIETLQKKLQGYITIGLSVYMDDELRTGVKYPGELSDRLCRSSTSLYCNE